MVESLGCTSLLHLPPSRSLRYATLPPNLVESVRFATLRFLLTRWWSRCAPTVSMVAQEDGLKGPPHPSIAESVSAFPPTPTIQLVPRCTGHSPSLVGPSALPPLSLPAYGSLHPSPGRPSRPPSPSSSLPAARVVHSPNRSRPPLSRYAPSVSRAPSLHEDG